MKKLGMGILCFSVTMTLIFCFVADNWISDLEKRVKNCEAQLRGVTDCVNDCVTGINEIYDELEKRNDDGK